MCVGGWGGVCAHVCRYPWRPGEDSLSPGVGVSKPFKVAVGSLSQVLCAFYHPVTVTPVWCWYLVLEHI